MGQDSAPALRKSRLLPGAPGPAGCGTSTRGGILEAINTNKYIYIYIFYIPYIIFSSGPDPSDPQKSAGYGRNRRPRAPQNQPNGHGKSLVSDAAVGDQPVHPYGVQIKTVKQEIKNTIKNSARKPPRTCTSFIKERYIQDCALDLGASENRRRPTRNQS